MVGIKKIAFLMLSFTASIISYADNYIVVSKEAKIFDEPNSKGYVTLNTKNEEIIVLPGMVFKTLDSTQGWNLIEYSPGLRGYLSEQVTCSSLKAPKSGSYSVKNSPTQKLEITGEGDKWSASIGDKHYNGKAFGNVIIFFDEKNVPVYSLVDMGVGSVVVTYDNNVTKFF